MSVLKVNEEEFYEKVIKFVPDEETPGEGDFMYQGDLPAVINFEIPGSEPCEKALAIMEELSEKYEGKVDVFLVDINSDKAIGMMFGIQSVPSCLVVSTVEDSDPLFINGVIPKDGYIQAIEKNLLGKAG